MIIMMPNDCNIRRVEFTQEVVEMIVKASDLGSKKDDLKDYAGSSEINIATLHPRDSAVAGKLAKALVKLGHKFEANEKDSRIVSFTVHGVSLQELSLYLFDQGIINDQHHAKIMSGLRESRDGGDR